MLAQRAEDIEIRIASASAGIARSALLRQQRATRRRALIEARVVLEADRDHALDAAGRIERPLELAAITGVVGTTKLQRELTDGDFVRWRTRGSLSLGTSGKSEQEEDR
jgi:hypothetical protein